MNLAQFSGQLTKLFNRLGNQWLTDNFETEPFDFKVYVRKGDSSDLTNYVVEVYTDRPIPLTIKYKKGKGPHGVDGIHYSVLSGYLKNLISYVREFGGLGQTLGVELMDTSMKGFEKKYD